MINTIEDLCQELNTTADKLDWDYISIYQKLSECFIEKHADKLDWDCISACQKLSEDFRKKHADKVRWDYISIFQNIL